MDDLGGEPAAAPLPVRTSGQARDMLRFDLDNERETSRNHRQRVRQCEALGEIALAEQLRGILVDEQDQLIALATALPREANSARPQRSAAPTWGHGAPSRREHAAPRCYSRAGQARWGPRPPAVR